jgi:peptidoglycan/LPS O-acetylase OafA/YrhL
MKYLFQVIALGLLLLTCVQLTAGAVRELSYLTIFGRLNQAVIGMIFGFTFDRYRRYLFSPIALFASLSIASSSLLWLHAAGGHQGTADSPLWIFWPSVEAFIWATVICTYQACSIKIPSLLSRLIAHLGAMSYSIYVVHYFFICALCAPFANLILSPHHRYQILEHAQNWLVKHPLETSLLSGIFVILPPVLVLSFFTFNVIERPFMRLRKKYILPCESPPPASDIEPGQYELAYQR